MCFQQVLVPKLIPFAKEIMKLRGEEEDTLVQEDNAPAHAHHAQADIFSFHEVKRLLWPGNSPDLNMIEPCWPGMKRRTTARGAPRDRKTAKIAWYKAWNDLPQEKI